ncbi:hypothetical protein RAS1_24790 [Phycisphaerae bacterium RAS1]|nr:hypothetical protein RAS1_24790 [Phycisphaerae bacterium RAS1]
MYRIRLKAAVAASAVAAVVLHVSEQRASSANAQARQSTSPWKVASITAAAAGERRTALPPAGRQDGPDSELPAGVVLGGGAVYTLTHPGSYYLTTNVAVPAGQHGIAIESGDVTLDLLGFEMVGGGAALDGIRVADGAVNVTIRNGTLRGFSGIGVNGGAAAVCRVDGIRVGDCGTGILAGRAAEVRRCVAENNGAGGIFVGHEAVVADCAANGSLGNGFYALESSRFSGCTARGNQGDGFYLDGDGCTVTHCHAIANGRYGVASIYGGTVVDTFAQQNAGHGIWTLSPMQIRECTATGNGTDGIFASDGATISGCTLRGNGENGLRAAAGSMVRGNHCFQHVAGAGILIVGDGGRIEENHVVGGAAGLRVVAGGNLLLRNSVSGVDTAYEIAAGNGLGPIVAGGDVELSESPNANFRLP